VFSVGISHWVILNERSEIVESNKNVIYIGLGIFAIVVIIFWMIPASVLRPILYTLLAIGSVLLILLVLIQRGRGGGLAGALGGMGGYSAFGTRAGDVFTRITIVAAALWILGAMALARMNVTGNRLYDNPGASVKKTLNQPSGFTSGSEKPGDESTTEESSPQSSDATSSDSKEKTDGESSDR
jgi:preprotein translocase subunit SecG